MDKENFLRNIRAIDNLKVRLSGGLVGNQEISDYAFTTSYSTGSYGGSSSYSKQNTANSKLKWESTASYNFGIDLGLWRDRVSIVFDAYYKKTSDLLLIVPMGFSSGVTSQLQNVGNVVNKGVEFAVNGTILQRKNLSWNISANIAYNNNKITDMGSTNNVIQGSDNQQILRRGEALGSFYGLRFIGIVQNGEDVSALPTVNGQTPEPGDLKYDDTDHNGRIDGNDRQILGSIQPDIVYGFNTQLTWHDFDFSASFAGSHGNEVYNALGRRLELTNDSYNVLSTVRDSWTPTRGGNTLPWAANARPLGYIDSRYVQSASYLKLRNLTIGYRLPRLQNVPVKIRVYATDSGAYPSSRSFVFGVNLTL